MEFDYEAQQDDELSLTVGDIIVNIRRDDGGWWEGELGGRRGLFPDNFVRVSNRNLPYPTFLLPCLTLHKPRAGPLQIAVKQICSFQCVTMAWFVLCVFAKIRIYIMM